ncbi:hypothetical protein A2U01_0105745 [Trifolium medium]|uniref:Uncharacterized protein n=1 Tax=Trifolium medium TaxID=97028 RepID=A0A392V8C6_9FABA|nr:hypothetical protein [Trifolium medium]
MLVNKTVPSEQTDRQRYSTSVTLLASPQLRQSLSWLNWCFRPASVTST